MKQTCVGARIMGFTSVKKGCATKLRIRKIHNSIAPTIIEHSK